MLNDKKSVAEKPLHADKTVLRNLSRRSVLAAGIAAPLIIPRHVLGQTAGRKAPSDTLNIAAVGIGGMGRNYVAGCKSENIAALADVDDTMGAPVFELYPKAKTYRDYRIMIEKEKGIDAVIVGTPDHSHAVIAMAAISLGKHVYVAKPMTRTIHEARTLTQAARDAGVATQMSVQSCCSDESLTTAEWIQAGAVGAVREIHVWSDRPVWPQGIARPADTPRVPSTLDWDVWLGPAPERPYHPFYHPFDFRGWYDFGTGALGDMACHSFHAFFPVLKLGIPSSVSASATFARVPAGDMPADPEWSRSRPVESGETFPPSSIVTWDFPARGNLPPLRMFWYDGGLTPPLPMGMKLSRKLAGDGVIFVGDKGSMLTGFTGGPILLDNDRQRSFTKPPKTMERSQGHYMEWIDACKGGKSANCNFDFGSVITEAALLGVIAQRLGGYLEWDADQAVFTNSDEANALVDPPYRTGWSL
ncbi:Gfo/Idh/MocA family protein [Candidatus Latescibacterota bacterium]